MGTPLWGLSKVFQVRHIIKKIKSAAAIVFKLKSGCGAYYYI